MGGESGVCEVLTNGVLRWQVHVVGVEELQEGAVHRVGELVDLDHLLVVLVPVGLEHAPEVLAPAQKHFKKKTDLRATKRERAHGPDLQNGLVDVDVFALDAELEVGRLGVVKLFLQGLGHGQEVVVLCRWDES